MTRANFIKLVVALFATGGISACKFPFPADVIEESDAAIPADAGVRTVTVNVEPQLGIGVVTAPTIGIDCGTSCTAEVTDGTRVSLMASAASGAAFVGWREDARSCGTQPVCSLVVEGASIDVGARFASLGEPAWITQVGRAPQGTTHVAADRDGNAIIATIYSAPLTFDGVTYEDSGLLLAKLSPSGDVLWHRVIIGLASSDGVAGLAVHRSTGDFVLLGTFRSTIDLGGPTPLILPGNDTADGFVARFDARGEWKWQRHIRASDTEELALGGVDLDAEGNIYVAGRFWEVVDLGDGPLTANTGAVFVGKLSSELDSVLWKRKVGGNDPSVLSTALAVDTFGVVVGGTFSETCNLGGANMIASGTADGFVAAYSSAAGAFRWQKQIGGSGMDAVLALAVDVNAHVYAAVSYAAITGETMTFAGSPVTGTGGMSGELVVGGVRAYDGSFVWARRFGSAGFDEPRGLAILADATIGLVGFYSGDITFGETTLSHSGNSDGFMVRLAASDGRPTFAGRVSSGGFDALNDIVGTSTEVVTVGRLAAQASVFGKLVTPVGATDGFAAAIILPP